MAGQEADELHGAELLPARGLQVALGEGPEHARVDRRREVVGAADRAARAESQRRQQPLVDAAGDVERAVRGPRHSPGRP